MILIEAMWKPKNSKEELLIEFSPKSLLWINDINSNCVHVISTNYAPGPALVLHIHCCIQYFTFFTWITIVLLTADEENGTRWGYLLCQDSNMWWVPKYDWRTVYTGNLYFILTLFCFFAVLFLVCLFVFCFLSSVTSVSLQAILTGREKQLLSRVCKMKPKGQCYRAHSQFEWLPGPELWGQPTNIINPEQDSGTWTGLPLGDLDSGPWGCIRGSLVP